MANLRIDRDALPKPWANPLIFVLTGSGCSLEAEIEQEAAIEYQSTWRAGGIASALAPQRTEYFVQSVEDAANRMLSTADPACSPRLFIRWSDLNPSGPGN